MKYFFSGLLTFLFFQAYSQNEPGIQADTVDTAIQNWVNITNSFGFKPTVPFPEIRTPEGILKTRRELGGDVISWVEEVNRLHYLAMQDSAFLYLQRYCSSLDSTETENTAYKKIVGDQLFLDFGCDLSQQLNQLPAINPKDQTEVELVNKYLFDYFESAHYKKGILKFTDFDDSLKSQFPFYHALNQIILLVK